MEMVKLRFISLQSGKTRKMEVRGDYSIEKLKSCLSISLFNTPNFAFSIRLYLDKEDELSPLSPDDSLLSLGIMLEVYIYYDVQQQGKSQIEDEKRVIKRRSPERDLIKRVILEDLGSDFSDNKLVFAAIHAVFLDSGFVAFDSVSGSQICLSDILKNQASVTNFTASVNYTFPQLLSGDIGDDTESIVLKFHDYGSICFEYFVDVSGCLAKSDKYSRLHELSILKFVYVPAIRSCQVKVILEFWKFVKDRLVFPLWINLCEKTGLDLPPCLIRLPVDLKLRILELLPGQDIAKVACVCKEMKYLSSNNELWKEKYMSQFGSGTAAAGAALGTNWKVKFGFLARTRRRGLVSNPYQYVSNAGSS